MRETLAIYLLQPYAECFFNLLLEKTLSLQKSSSNQSAQWSPDLFKMAATYLNGYIKSLWKSEKSTSKIEILPEVKWRQLYTYYLTSKKGPVGFHRHPYNTKYFYSFLNPEFKTEFDFVRSIDDVNEDIKSLQLSLLKGKFDIISPELSLDLRVSILSVLTGKYIFGYNNPEEDLSLGLLEITGEKINLSLDTRAGKEEYSGYITSYSNTVLGVAFNEKTHGEKRKIYLLIALNNLSKRKKFIWGISLGTAFDNSPFSTKTKLLALNPEDELHQKILAKAPLITQFQSRGENEWQNQEKDFNKIIYPKADDITWMRYLRLQFISLADSDGSTVVFKTEDKNQLEIDSTQASVTMKSAFYYIWRKEYDRAYEMLKLALDKGLTEIKYLDRFKQFILHWAEGEDEDYIKWIASEVESLKFGIRLQKSQMELINMINDKFLS